jgi:hypothetical protein
MRVGRWLSVAICVMGLALAGVADAKELKRGKPNSDARKEWCANQRDLCEADGNKRCGELAGIAANGCRIGVINSCRDSFGPGTRCETQERVQATTPPSRATVLEWSKQPPPPPKPASPAVSPKSVTGATKNN